MSEEATNEEQSTLRGFVYRKWHPVDDSDDHWCEGPWAAFVGNGTWFDESARFGPYIGYFATQPEALAAVCQRLMDEAVAEDIVRRAEGKEAGA